MSPKRQPLSLYQSCIIHISQELDFLCRQHVHSLQHPSLVAATQFLKSNLPPHLQQAIGEVLLSQSERLQQAMLPTQVNVLLDLRVKRLCILGSVVQSGVFEEASANHLEQMSLYYGGCGDRAHKLYPFLYTAVNVTHLQCTDFCNNQMLEIIASTCRHLYCLDLRGCDVTDEGILKLCGLHIDLRDCIQILSKGGTVVPTSACTEYLKEIKLTMTKVTEAGIAVVLLVLTNIFLLRVPDIRMEQVFNFLQTLDYKDVQCRLKEFHSREILNEFQLTVLTELCPNLEYIQVSFIGNTEMDLSRLRQLTRLSRLRRAKFADVNCDALMWFLEELGHQIEQLYLYTYHTRFSQEKLMITRRHLQNMAQFCPNLENFCLDGYSLGEGGLISQSQHELNYFRKLHTLQLVSMKLSEEDLKVFLSKCHKMRILELVLQNPHVVHDKLITELLNSGVWKDLVKIRILNSPITSKIMQRLVNECPSLQVLGCLYTWLISKQQVVEFKEKIKLDNLDIEVY